MINLLTRGLLGAARQSFYRWRQRGPDLSGGVLNSGFGENASLNNDASTVAVYSPFKQYQSNPLRFTGTVLVFRWNGQKYVQIGQELTLNESNNAFGKQLRLSSNGNRLAIKKNGEGYIYDFNGTQWNELSNFILTESLDLSGNGLRFVKGNTTGGATVYDYNGSTWVGSTAFGTQNLGLRISANGNRVVNQSGEIFEFQGGNWVQIVNLNLPTPYQFAGHLWLNADGTMLAYSSGLEVKIFKQNTGGAWAQLGNSFLGGGQNFVMSCAMSANGRVLIKDQVPNAPENTWTAKVYEFTNNAWQQIAPTRVFYDVLTQSPAQISGDGKNFGFSSTDSPNIRDGSPESYSVHRKELD